MKEIYWNFLQSIQELKFKTFEAAQRVNRALPLKERQSSWDFLQAAYSTVEYSPSPGKRLKLTAPTTPSTTHCEDLTAFSNSEHEVFYALSSPEPVHYVFDSDIEEPTPTCDNTKSI